MAEIYDNPFLSSDDDDFCWLDMPHIPNVHTHPFDRSYSLYDQSYNPVEELVETLCNPNYLHFLCSAVLNFHLIPFQLAILDVLWHRRLPMLIASRGASKSTLLAVYAILRMITHPGCRIVVVGGAFRQSKQIFEYMLSIWNNAPILRDICLGTSKKGGPHKEVDRYEFTIGDSVTYFIPLGDGSKIRGLRANYILCDEFSSINEEVFQVVVQGFGLVSANPTEKVKAAYRRKQLLEMGLTEEELMQVDGGLSGNQIVYSGTAYYAFNHFYKYFKKWHAIIASKGDPKKLQQVLGDDAVLKGFDWRDYAILRVPYDSLPPGFLDDGIIAQAKATLHTNQFLMELCAVFPEDSNGFFRRSVIEMATTNKPIAMSDGTSVQFIAKRYGDIDKRYIIGVDPAADQDNAAIVVLENNENYRAVVHCWTTNKKRYQTYKKDMAVQNKSYVDDYYHYIAKKIRSIMRFFPVESIMMDKHGGGIAVAEALSSTLSCEADELPVYEVIDPNDPKHEDTLNGLHILELVKPTPELNSNANHGMLKDLQQKVLLFPMYDTIELAKSIEIDNMNDNTDDTYENIVLEIEELKNELATITMTSTGGLGREHFDTPEIKLEGNRKGRLRKDRYSALLYANYKARSKVNEIPALTYRPVGATKETLSDQPNRSRSGNLYYGPGTVGKSNKMSGIFNTKNFLVRR